MRFDQLQIHPLLLKGVEDCGFSECTPVQKNCIPLVRQGKDLSGLAQTGTGKTAAFLTPLMDRVLLSKESNQLKKSPSNKEPVPTQGTNAPSTLAFESWRASHFVLILVPTRELAEQVYTNAKQLSAHTKLSSCVIYGGVGYEDQKQALKQHSDFVIATPGRLIDLYKEHCLNLNCVRAVVFDEADQMFDLGFRDDICFILERIPRKRQLILLGATANFETLRVAYEFGSNPIEIDLSTESLKTENVEDDLFHVGHEEKPNYLLSLIKKHKPQQVIVFANFKYSIERLSHFLKANKVAAMGISSLLSQAQRQKVMSSFRKSETHCQVLVATDVAARGLDITGVDMVINYDLPDDPANYVHRIGRTGRAGKVGCAHSLVSHKDVDALKRIESYTDKKIPSCWLEDDEIITDIKPLRFESAKPRPVSASGQDRPTRRGPRRTRTFSKDHEGRDSERRSPRGGTRGGAKNSYRGSRAAHASTGSAARPYGSRKRPYKKHQDKRAQDFKPSRRDRSAPSYKRSRSQKPAQATGLKRVVRGIKKMLGL